MGKQSIDVFGYMNYRAYLHDFYREKKATGRGFSFRVFSRLAGLGSPNYLKLVMDGDRNLTAQMAERFADACGLKGESAAFFCELVGFNQAKDTVERTERFGRLTTFRKYRAAHQLELAQAAYYSNWYLPAIRELAARKDFSDDPAWVARNLLPVITVAEATMALEKLRELGLLVTNEAGRLVQGADLVTTGDETRLIHVRSFHRTMITRALEAIDQLPKEDREISSLTLCLGSAGLKRFKERIQRFQDELLDLSALESDPEQVIQINFQLFPLSQRRNEDDV
ncbi:TIGR02147 family protein [Vulgatibacter sp.]|uniref:TIGR02147 family protein n=1 Tax=Vulgatibacter sp. TaxID=1971226 RepID=UPI003563363A